MRTDSLANIAMTPTYFRILLRNLGLPRKVIEAALRRANLRPASISDPDQRVTLGEQLGVFSEVVDRMPPDWWLKAGRRFHIGTHGALGFAFMSAPDLRTSLETLERFGPVRLPYVRAREAVRSGGRYALAFEVIPRIEPSARVAMMEMVAVVRKGFVESVAGDSISEVSFEFGYPAPAHSDLYGRELGVPVRFDCSQTAMVIPESLLDRECATADPALFASAIDRLEAKQRQLAGEHSVIGHLEVLLDASGDAGVSVEEAASALGMSRRSLTRRLSEAGTSFRLVRDHHRRSRAELLLRDRSLDLDEIAWRLGYGNVANLGRATRRWFGMPPGRYRHSLE